MQKGDAPDELAPPLKNKVKASIELNFPTEGTNWIGVSHWRRQFAWLAF